MIAAPTTSPPAGGGLSDDVARQRLAETGPNEITRARTVSRWRILLTQFTSPLIWVLLFAGALSAFLGERADAIAISVIVIINATVGFVQEHRAERAMQALRAMTAPRARVLRGGHQKVIAASEVVPGDLLLLEAGDLVAADAQVLEAHALSTNEAALTGESLPVEKQTRPSAPDAPLA
ncbi:MAG TPA: HAD-IC family P-type ATPase, partial [Polyangia bacterium]